VKKKKAREVGASRAFGVSRAGIRLCAS
jgi:hypothetical protein